MYNTVLLMGKYNFKFKLAHIILCALLLAACGNGKDLDNDGADSIPDSSSQTDTPEEVIKPAVAVKTDTLIQPEESVIVFDASKSMQGYADATVNGDFPGVISELNNAGKRSLAYLYDIKKTPISNFVSKFQNKQIPWAKESDLFGMVGEILNSASTNPANCYALVTDGTMSGSNAEIKADPTYNISKPAILQGKIDSLVNHIPEGKDISVLVAAYMAPFKGVYYAYDNSKKDLENEPRPFYVLVAGGTPQVNYMADKLSKQGNGKIVQYGVKYPMPLTANAILTGKNRYKVNKTVKDDGLSISVTLDKLPTYARNINYLRKNLEVERTLPRGNTAILILSTEDGEGDYTITEKGNKAEIKFNKKINYTLPASFTLRLKRVQPQWVEDMSTPNDKTQYRPDATLNLNYFLRPFLRLNNAECLNNEEQSKIEIIK